MPSSKAADDPVEQVVTKAVKERASKRVATFSDLIKKKRRTDEVTLRTRDDAGEELELVVRLQAIGSTAYDELLAAHPPTKKQREAGATYNVDTFAPEIIAACSLEPKLTLEQAKEIYGSEEWSGGEIGGLLFTAQRLCNAGIDVPFSVGD